jgi:hypothetical protein
MLTSLRTAKKWPVLIAGTVHYAILGIMLAANHEDKEWLLTDMCSRASQFLKFLLERIVSTFQIGWEGPGNLVESRMVAFAQKVAQS